LPQITLFATAVYVISILTNKVRNEEAAVLQTLFVVVLLAVAVIVDAQQQKKGERTNNNLSFLSSGKYLRLVNGILWV
jgi:hypothetical protein